MKRCLACEARFERDGWTCPSCGYEPAHGDFPLFAPEAAGTDEGMERGVFSTLARLEPTSFWFRNRNRVLVSVLRQSFPDARNMLEVGCGTGYVLAAVRAANPALRLTGGELYVEALEAARERLPDVELVQVDGRRLPYEHEFDVAGAFDVLEHVDEDEAVLAELARALRPGGGLLVTVPQHRWLWSSVDDYSHHKRRYRRRELVTKLERAGFGVRRVTSFVTVLLPVMALSRMVRRRQATDELDPYADFRLPRAVDRAFELFLTGERALLDRGVSLPAGGSLLAVARRAA